jgi:hypothetical protein
MKQEPAIKNGVVMVCPGSPRYLAYMGSPIILITSAEQYGAVINLDFDYIAYLDKLSKYELNYTRIFPGAYFETEGMFLADNVLAPKPGRLTIPWARSSEPGYAGGGNKFDLDAWDVSYFVRLKDFINQAEQRGIVVEICFFNCQYPEGWSHCPLNAANNIQGVGDCGHEAFQTLRHPDMVKAQDEYVRKIVQEVNSFDNVILEICDEPTLKGTPGWEAVAWISHLVDFIAETEKTLPKKHVIAQQIEVGVDFTADCRVPLIVTQYVEQNENRQVGGIEALDSEYHHGKPIELNETSIYPIWYAGDVLADSRVEAWEFLVGGGASFNQLNGLFNAISPAGEWPDNENILGGLQILKHFMYGFRFEKMQQDKDFIQRVIPMGADVRCLNEQGRQYAPTGAHIRCISEPGKQYAIYIHHSVINDHLSYIVAPGNYAVRLDVELPAGTYRCEWIDPETGSVVDSRIVNHDGGIKQLMGPQYKIDIALKIVSVA